MIFITDTPKLFNVETGVTVSIKPVMDYAQPPYSVWEVVMGKERLHMGTRKECEDYIYSLAGWVGAVNPVTLEKVTQ